MTSGVVAAMRVGKRLAKLCPKPLTLQYCGSLQCPLRAESSNCDIREMIMKASSLIVALVGVAFLTAPVFAMDRVSNMKYKEAARACAAKVAAKHVAAADKAAEMNKCKDDPNAY
jgi:hypothetical protein